MPSSFTLYKQIKFFNLFKETAANNMGIIHGFPNWANKIRYEIEEDDLLIIIPPLLIKRGGYEYISKSKRKEEVDSFMYSISKAKKYTFIEYVINLTCDIFVNFITDGQVKSVTKTKKK